MTKENLAEQSEAGGIDDLINEALAEDKPESAPAREDKPEVEKPEVIVEESEEPEEVNSFQKRINKVTADKWEEKRRADALQEELDKLKSAQPQTQSTDKPELESFDYDEASYQEALIDWKIQQRQAEAQKQQQLAKETESKQAAIKVFDERAAAFSADKPDFAEVLGKVPTLQPAVLSALMLDEKGPELSYYLGNNLDVADKVASMNPVAAAIELGKISEKLAKPKQIKPSSAPEPIEPIASGGTVSSSMGDDMPIDEWMKKFNS